MGRKILEIFDTLDCYPELRDLVFWILAIFFFGVTTGHEIPVLGYDRQTATVALAATAAVAAGGSIWAVFRNEDRTANVLTAVAVGSGALGLLVDEFSVFRLLASVFLQPWYPEARMQVLPTIFLRLVIVFGAAVIALKLIVGLMKR